MNRDELIKVLNGERPERSPLIPAGIRNQREIERLTRMLADMSLDAVDMMLERGIEMIEVADDLGSLQGLLISPEIFREFFLPWYEELAARVHQAGAYLHLHSHGNIESVLPDLVSCGVDVINPFDWHENPDLPGLVRRFGKDIVFCGGVMGDLYLHSLQEVEFIVRRACGLSKIAERGFILMGYGMADEIDRERWNRTREIFDRAREEEL